ncbi:hypothetical protein L917_21427 [Phytophthora nicotianae]|uniref:Uncharacterized protein n=1 Tax=Phytophthora nicotianae TaxID=4792 RepID=W2JZQ8_PHYNI|nr:hypothetical protein L917_21427 [Phytophthora nicotianae]
MSLKYRGYIRGAFRVSTVQLELAMKAIPDIMAEAPLVEQHESEHGSYGSCSQSWRWTCHPAN